MSLRHYFAHDPAGYHPSMQPLPVEEMKDVPTANSMEVVRCGADGVLPTTIHQWWWTDAQTTLVEANGQLVLFVCGYWGQS